VSLLARVRARFFMRSSKLSIMAGFPFILSALRARRLFKLFKLFKESALSFGGAACPELVSGKGPWQSRLFLRCSAVLLCPSSPSLNSAAMTLSI
jgi:hypothetical protein